MLHFRVIYYTDSSRQAFELFEAICTKASKTQVKVTYYSNIMLPFLHIQTLVIVLQSCHFGGGGDSAVAVP